MPKVLPEHPGHGVQGWVYGWGSWLLIYHGRGRTARPGSCEHSAGSHGGGRTGGSSRRSQRCPNPHGARMLRWSLLLLCLLLPCSEQQYLENATRIMESTPVIDG